MKIMRKVKINWIRIRKREINIIIKIIIKIINLKRMIINKRFIERIIFDFIRGKKIR